MGNDTNNEAMVLAFEADAAEHTTEYAEGKRAVVYALATVNPGADKPYEVSQMVNGNTKLVFMAIARMLLGLRDELSLTNGDVVGRILDIMIGLDADGKE